MHGRYIIGPFYAGILLVLTQPLNSTWMGMLLKIYIKLLSS